MEEWKLVRKGADFNAIAQKFEISPRVAALIRNRDILGDDNIERYLHGSLSDLYDGMLMKDMNNACTIISEKIDNEKKIRVIGDYDIDGICASYILLSGLKELGAHADSDIPDRIHDGYGINQELIERAYKEDIDTIITCDNGIAAYDAIEYAKRLGITVIITDHHEVPYEEDNAVKRYILPSADAIVNPKQSDCMYPFKGLCGAGVAYKLIEALFEIRGMDISELDYLLEIVAIATIGDVMELKDENRIFVKEGLYRLRKTGNLGLNALIDVVGIDKENISVYHIGFVIGPCLNASGRLDTAKRALSLLQCTSRQEASTHASDLKALNDSRKEMTEQAVRDAVTYYEEKNLKHRNVIVIYLPDWHESLAGIVAGRIREQYYKPTFVITDSKDSLKGSGRSIDTYNMYEGLCRCKDILLKFGGHKLAAGLSIKKENLEVFEECVNEQSGLSKEDFNRKIKIDMEIPFTAINEKMIEDLSILEPFGVGNTKPVFAKRRVRLEAIRIFGSERKVLKCRVTDEQSVYIDGVVFNEAEDMKNKVENKMIDILFYPTINEYKGYRNLQVVITNYRII
ncbi:MAG: single-stranded-DNA-specific exonuclease RecJ [Suipraeoptans sp.]